MTIRPLYPSPVTGTPPSGGSKPAGASRQPATPSSSPKGDASLWSILTTDERDFFMRVGNVGQLTYGPGAARATPSADAPTGQRVDVRA